MNPPPDQRTRSWLDVLSVLLLLTAFVLAFVVVQRLGIETIRAYISDLGWWAPVAVVALRSLSIVFPAIPSTVYSLLAGTLFGLGWGIVIIATADLLACTLNFYLAKRYGRRLVQRLVGQRWMGRVDALATDYLEGNVFLVAGLLMTGLFDFVSYAVGLTRLPWRAFVPALLVGVGVSTPPVVALGAGLVGQGRWLLGLGLLGVFGLALLTAWLKRPKKQAPQDPVLTKSEVEQDH